MRSFAISHKKTKYLLQCKVASDGNGVEEDVVRRELAPFSSSIRMLAAQNGKNLAKVLTGSALATHSTSWWIALTAFVRTQVLAYSKTIFKTRSNNGSDRWTHIWLHALVTASIICTDIILLVNGPVAVKFNIIPSLAPPALPFAPSSGKFSSNWITRRINDATQSGKSPVDSYRRPLAHWTSRSNTMTRLE